MRLWHKDLVPVLPRQQILGQWRECCAIARNIHESGTPNHILVNRVLDYPESQFNVYALAIHDELIRREYKCDWNKFIQWRVNRNRELELADIFSDWHNDRYLRQCLYSLEEKVMCGGIPCDEWKRILDKYGEQFDLWSI